MLCCNDFKQTSALPNVMEQPLLDIWRNAVGAVRAQHANGCFDREPCLSCRVNVVPFRMPAGMRRSILRRTRRQRLLRGIVPAAFVPPGARRRRFERESPFGYIDVPGAHAVVGGAFLVQGWALAAAGRTIERIDVRVDGQRRSAARSSAASADVWRSVPRAKATVSAASAISRHTAVEQQRPHARRPSSTTHRDASRSARCAPSSWPTDLAAGSPRSAPVRSARSATARAARRGRHRNRDGLQPALPDVSCGGLPHSMNGRRPTMMGARRLSTVVDQISDRPRSILLNVFGEIALHPDLIEFIRIAKTPGHHVALFTNGTKLTPGRIPRTSSTPVWTRSPYRSTAFRTARTEACGWAPTKTRSSTTCASSPLKTPRAAIRCGSRSITFSRRRRHRRHRRSIRSSCRSSRRST